ncbi:hypothetical protein [Streptomyces marincola]|uniref:hypothetical protein n=1 Tax=Streptomyces marincola TaxID=2878388 RepID=UPI00210018E1|nr:hypothetical protein [Streptomyces marincola]
MRFEVEADEEFDAVCGLLVARMARWAAERGLPLDGFTAEAALTYGHRSTVDGRLGLWEPRHVEELLVAWAGHRTARRGACRCPGHGTGDAALSA